MIRHSIVEGHFAIGGVIWLNENITLDDAWIVSHEWGHLVQERILGPLYIPIIAIPSAISSRTNSLEDHRNQWFERNASWIGGVSR